MRKLYLLVRNRRSLGPNVPPTYYVPYTPLTRGGKAIGPGVANCPRTPKVTRHMRKILNAVSAIFTWNNKRDYTSHIKRGSESYQEYFVYNNCKF